MITITYVITVSFRVSHMFMSITDLGDQSFIIYFQAQVLPGEDIVVSQIAASPSGNHIAVGYVDGNINVFELTNSDVVCVFAGHKSAVTCLQYDEQGHRLVSGAKVSVIIILSLFPHHISRHNINYKYKNGFL